MSRILGAVLAGGRSRRFGSDKALATLGGRALLDHACDIVMPWVDEVVVCGRDGGLPDRPTVDLGPLGGLNAALHHGRARGFEAVLSIACDTPVVRGEALADLIEQGASAYLVECPVIGLWSCSAADELDALLASGSASMRSWADRIGARSVAHGRAVPNVNTTADLLWLAIDHVP